MSVLVDSCVWIDYFRKTKNSATLELLIEENLVTTNELILAELVPALKAHKQDELIYFLKEVKRQPMNIIWEEIIEIQSNCMKNGITRIGIPDLIIAQNAIQGQLRFLSNDKHFSLIAKYTPLELYQSKHHQ